MVYNLHKMYEIHLPSMLQGKLLMAGYCGNWYECVRNMDCYPDMFILKTDADGNEEWSRIEASITIITIGEDAIQTQDGNYVVAGTWNDDG